MKKLGGSRITKSAIGDTKAFSRSSAKLLALRPRQRFRVRRSRRRRPRLLRSALAVPPGRGRHRGRSRAVLEAARCGERSERSDLAGSPGRTDRSPQPHIGMLSRGCGSGAAAYHRFRGERGERPLSTSSTSDTSDELACSYAVVAGRQARSVNVLCGSDERLQQVDVPERA